jgi:hypothetical protein
VLSRTLISAAVVLGVWNLAVIARARQRESALSVRIILTPQHYLQACAQGSVLADGGWYWQPVYDSAHLIVAQLLSGRSGLTWGAAAPAGCISTPRTTGGRGTT